MGETINKQKITKKDVDQKLLLIQPNRELLQELAIACANNPKDMNTTFQYAFALSKSINEPSELRYSIGLLDSLVINGFQHQIDCMYGAATALYLLGEYDEARLRCEAILRSNPESRIAKELHLACVEASEEKQREEMKNFAIGSVAIAAAVGALGIAGALLAKR